MIEGVSYGDINERGARICGWEHVVQKDGHVICGTTGSIDRVRFTLDDPNDLIDAAVGLGLIKTKESIEFWKSIYHNARQERLKKVFREMVSDKISVAILSDEQEI